MTPRTYLGELEELTLLALLRLGAASDGGAVRAELASTAERRVSASTVYLTLMRLEEKGLVASSLREPAAGGSRPRREFSILPEGVEELRRSREVQVRMWDDFERHAARALTGR